MRKSSSLICLCVRLQPKLIHHARRPSYILPFFSKNKTESGARTTISLFSASSCVQLGISLARVGIDLLLVDGLLSSYKKNVMFSCLCNTKLGRVIIFPHFFLKTLFYSWSAIKIETSAHDEDAAY